MINKPNDFSKNSERFFMMIEDKYQTALIDYDYNHLCSTRVDKKSNNTWKHKIILGEIRKKTEIPVP